MALKDTQQEALEYLRSWISPATTGILHVDIDAADAINELPILVIFDEGMLDRRVPGSGRRELEWDLQLQVFVQLSDLATAMRKCRDIRGDLIDRLGKSLTLGHVVSRTVWKEGLKAVDLEYGGVKYAGLTGVLTLILNDAFSYE